MNSYRGRDGGGSRAMLAAVVVVLGILAMVALAVPVLREWTR